MELIRSFEQLGKNDARIAGGKGASLGELTAAGISVPPGYVILAVAFERFLDEANLNQELDAILHTVNREEMHMVENASERIQQLILATRIPEDIADEIQKRFKNLDAEFVAVRSSATAEDGASAAWAGQLDTFLNTTADTLLQNVQKCWASLFTPRAIFYRFEKGMHGAKISVAVVVQKMVQSEVSGIAFSVHPVTEDPNQLIIEGGFGLGEAIVSGHVTPDSFVVEKIPRRIIDKNITFQSKALWRSESGGNEWRQLSQEEGSKPALLDPQVMELTEIILKIEEHYGFPCDIEWAFEAGHFFITQSRPITTLKGASAATGAWRPHVSNYRMTWEGHGVSFIFEYVLGHVYFPPESYTVVRNGVVQEYMSHKILAQMAEEGTRRSPDEVQAKIDEMKEAAIACRTEADQLLSQQLTKESVEKLFDICKRIMRMYYYFDAGFWETAFSIGRTDERVRASVELAQGYKNIARAEFDTFYFGDGVLPRLLKQMEAQTGVPAREIELYTESELHGIFDGKRVDSDELERRRVAYVSDKDDKGDITLLTGQDALNAISEFFAGAGPEASDSFRGMSAHTTGDIVRGRVYIVSRDYNDPVKMHREMDTMQQGDILVTQTTDPEMMPALRKASAAVTDIGGMLSHTAIVARELNIPCIVGTGNASKILKTGDMIEVDANTGIVRVIEKS